MAVEDLNASDFCQKKEENAYLWPWSRFAVGVQGFLSDFFLLLFWTAWLKENSMLS